MVNSVTGSPPAEVGGGGINTNLELLLAQCAAEPTNRTLWLITADALDESGRAGEAALVRSDTPARLLGGYVVPYPRVPGWYLVYSPDHDQNHPWRALPGCFCATCGYIMRGEEQMRRVMSNYSPLLLTEYDPDATSLGAEPLDLDTLPIDSGELAEIAEFIATRHSDTALPAPN